MFSGNLMRNDNGAVVANPDRGYYDDRNERRDGVYGGGGWVTAAVPAFLTASASAPQPLPIEDEINATLREAGYRTGPSQHWHPPSRISRALAWLGRTTGITYLVDGWMASSERSSDRGVETEGSRAPTFRYGEYAEIGFGDYAPLAHRNSQPDTRAIRSADFPDGSLRQFSGEGRREPHFTGEQLADALTAATDFGHELKAIDALMRRVKALVALAHEQQVIIAVKDAKIAEMQDKAQKVHALAQTLFAAPPSREALIGPAVPPQAVGTAQQGPAPPTDTESNPRLEG